MTVEVLKYRPQFTWSLNQSVNHLFDCDYKIEMYNLDTLSIFIFRTSSTVTRYKEYEMCPKHNPKHFSEGFVAKFRCVPS